MNEIRILQLFLYLCLIKINCSAKQKQGYNKFLPYFRKQAEEIDDRLFTESTDRDDPHRKFVSIMMHNPKEIFHDLFEKSELEHTKLIFTTDEETLELTTAMIIPTVTIEPSTELLKPTTTRTTTSPSPEPTISITTSVTTVDNIEETSYNNISLMDTSKENDDMTTEFEDLNTKLIKLEPSRPQVTYKRLSPSKKITSFNKTIEFSTRSCIICNNIALEDCNSPKNKTIQSIDCERPEDVCYSMHTPFGIVDRGCFNPDHNLTTYVCSCNLCNYLPITDMPYQFLTKTEWINNVIDISRMRRLQRSVYQDMSCLRCEVDGNKENNLTLNTGCLQGNINLVPQEQCDDNEVCAVRTVRAEGYIWRGCAKAPLYNYWWGLCGQDHCNDDSIVSLYDFL